MIHHDPHLPAWAILLAEVSAGAGVAHSGATSVTTGLAIRVGL